MAGLWGKPRPKHGRPTVDETVRQRQGKRYTWGTANPKPGNTHRKAARPDPRRWYPW